MTTTVTVWVRRHWNDNLSAEYALDDLSGVHWSRTSGGEVYGTARRSPRPMVHGYVDCDRAVSGELSHSCTHGPPPHRIKVCVVGKDNARTVMEQLKITATTNANRRLSTRL